MTFGITPTGYNRKTLNDILTSLETKLRASFGAPRLNVRDPRGVLASIVLPFSDELSGVHELGEDIYNALDPQRSTGQAYSAVAALRGVLRKLATVGTHAGMQFTFDDAVAGTIERGSIRFHPTGDVDNVWINFSSFTIGSSGDYSIAVESEEPGSTKTFEQGSAVTILDGPSELSAIVVPSDAVAGTDLETETAWRARSDSGLQTQGTSPIDALTSEIEAVEGVVSARVIETPANIRVVVFDNGGSADDDAIAQAIWDGKAGGVIPIGLFNSGTAVDKFGEDQIVPFDRATSVRIYVDITVAAPDGVSTADLKAALKGAMPTRSGQSVIWSKLNGGAVAVDGVNDVIDLFVGTSPSPTSESNISIDTLSIAELDGDDISISVL